MDVTSEKGFFSNLEVSKRVGISRAEAQKRTTIVSSIFNNILNRPKEMQFFYSVYVKGLTNFMEDHHERVTFNVKNGNIKG